MKLKRKSILSLVLCWVLSFTSQAQAFEGTVNMSITMEITDPSMKKNMEKAQQQLASPETQAKLQELQKQMNDPQMKAIFEQNPQLKDMLEKQMAAMQNNQGNAVEGFAPKSIQVNIKNGNTLAIMKGGMFDSEILYLKDKDKTYVLDRKNKTYSTQGSTDKTQSNTQVTVTKTAEKETILGYSCTKYIVETVEKNQKMTYFVWSTTELKDLLNSNFSNLNVGKNQNSNFLAKVDGVAMKIYTKTPEMNITLLVTEIKKQALSSDMFTLPAEFTEKK